MSPRYHFSQKGGPYFVNDGFTSHHGPIDTTRVSFIDRVKAFFKFPRPNRQK